MFSGIVESVGKVRKLQPRKEGVLLILSTTLPLAKIRIGDSVSCNGCCLTVTAKKKGTLEFFVSHESLAKTSFAKARVGDAVNLERALPNGARLDGHMVQGHVEAIGLLKAMRPVGECVEIEVVLPSDLKALVIPKGSIALDGVSLTINTIEDVREGVVIGLNLIPHTLKHTAFSKRNAGDAINVESDLLGRYVARSLEVYRQLGK